MCVCMNFKFSLKDNSLGSCPLEFTFRVVKLESRSEEEAEKKKKKMVEGWSVAVGLGFLIFFW